MLQCAGVGLRAITAPGPVPVCSVRGLAPPTAPSGRLQPVADPGVVQQRDVCASAAAAVRCCEGCWDLSVCKLHRRARAESQRQLHGCARAGVVHWRGSGPATNTAWTPGAAYTRAVRSVRQRNDVLHAWAEPAAALPRWRPVLRLQGRFLRLQLASVGCACARYRLRNGLIISLTCVQLRLLTGMTFRLTTLPLRSRPYPFQAISRGLYPPSRCHVHRHSRGTVGSLGCPHAVIPVPATIA